MGCPTNYLTTVPETKVPAAINEWQNEQGTCFCAYEFEPLVLNSYEHKVRFLSEFLLKRANRANLRLIRCPL